MVQCDRCDTDVDLPFRCNYCGGYFCSKHRLPEFHDCTGLYQRRPVSQWATGSSSSSRDYVYNVPRGRSSIRNLFQFSEIELRHLGISLIIIAALPLISFGGIVFQYPIVAVGAVVIFALAFLLHELAHKFMAQKLGYWAEYRLNNWGLLITLFSFFSPFKLIAPGAVMIAGLMYGDDYGKISLSGPVTNIAQGIILLAIMVTSPNDFVLYNIARLGVVINSSLALFNLLPFGVFDGVKIMRWDWRAWLIAAASAAALYFYAS